LSTLTAGVMVLVLSVLLEEAVAVVPMAALVAVMVFVAWSAFDWHSIRPSTLRAMPKSETTVMLVTVVSTVATGNLAVGVGLGVLAAMVLFARRVAHVVTVHRAVQDGPDGGATATYTVDGALFWASSNDLYTQFEYLEDPERVVIDLSRSHVWDASTVASLDAITDKYARYGKAVEVIGLNRASAAMRDRLRGRLTAGD
jgi:SulP family sulfate permease